MRAALRPGGLLLDLHPDTVHSSVEAYVGGATIPVGQLDETRQIQDVRLARAARQTAIDAGWFALERETRFTYISHFDSVETWLTYMAEHARKAVVPAELVASARELLPTGTAGELRRPRVIYAARLRRL